MTRLVRGAENGGWKTDFSTDRTDVKAGSAILAPRSALFETHFRVRGNTGGLVWFGLLARHVESGPTGLACGDFGVAGGLESVAGGPFISLT